MAVAAPIQVQPGNQVLGNDGNWTTFELRVGTPPQTVNILPSTLVSEDWVITPQGCSISSDSNCMELRGGFFDNTSSSSYEMIGGGQYFSLAADQNLGSVAQNDGGYYGYDTVGITAADGSGIVLDHQVIAQIYSIDFYVGVMGLSKSVTGVGNNNQSSFLESLRQQNKIPSLSYSYTAGAYYRESAPDLTLGGQDLSRMEPNDVNFTLANAVRDMMMSLTSISSTSQGKTTQLLNETIQIFIDTTLPYMWLPSTACAAFADAFGLEQDEITQRWALKNGARETNIKNNASVTFMLANQPVGGQSVNITFPYSAFDMTFTDESSSVLRTFSYFPIMNATDAQTYTLGRTFLQEAYLSVNHDYQNFSVFQAIPSGEQPPHVVALPALGGSPTGPSNPSSTQITAVQQGSGFPTGAIAGIVVAVVVLAAIGGYFWWRHHRKSKMARFGEYHAPATQTAAPGVPELSEKPLSGPVEPVDYFGSAAKDPTAYHATAVAGVTSNGTSPGELESPNLGHSGFSSPGIKQVATMGSPSELDHAETPRAELPSRADSTRMAHRMSGGPSPSLNPQGGAGAISPRAGTSRAHPSWPETHFDDTITPLSNRPSLLSADSVSFSNVGAAAVVHHSRDRSSNISGSAFGGARSPAHSTGPSIDDSIFMATRAGYSDSMAGPSSHGASRHVDRPALQRSVSQDTLVNSNGIPSGRASPLTERHSGHQQLDQTPETPVDEPQFDIPAGASLGFPSNRERFER